MPCKDTKSQISIVLDSKDHLLDFEYSKMTCSKEIDAGSGFREYCIGKPVDILSRLEFDDLINVFQLCDTESQFLLYLIDFLISYLIFDYIFFHLILQLSYILNVFF